MTFRSGKSQELCDCLGRLALSSDEFRVQLGSLDDYELGLLCASLNTLLSDVQCNQPHTIDQVSNFVACVTDIVSLATVC